MYLTLLRVNEYIWALAHIFEMDEKIKLNVFNLIPKI